MVKRKARGFGSQPSGKPSLGISGKVLLSAISENWEIISAFAWQGYQEQGRGLLSLALAEGSLQELMNHPSKLRGIAQVRYVSRQFDKEDWEFLEKQEDSLDETVTQYDPKQLVVLCIEWIGHKGLIFMSLGIKELGTPPENYNRMKGRLSEFTGTLEEFGLVEPTLKAVSDSNLPQEIRQSTTSIHEHTRQLLQQHLWNWLTTYNLFLHPSVLQKVGGMDAELASIKADIDRQGQRAHYERIESKFCQTFIEGLAQAEEFVDKCINEYATGTYKINSLETNKLEIELLHDQIRRQLGDLDRHRLLVFEAVDFLRTFKAKPVLENLFCLFVRNLHCDPALRQALESTYQEHPEVPKADIWNSVAFTHVVRAIVNTPWNKAIADYQEQSC